MSRAGDALRDERGMTIVELMVAMLICVVGIMATVALVDRSRAVSTKAEAREMAAHHADRELEEIMAMPWDQIAHNPTAPADTGAANPADPGSYVDGTNYQWDQDGSPLGAEPMKVLPGGQ